MRRQPVDNPTQKPLAEPENIYPAGAGPLLGDVVLRPYGYREIWSLER